MFTLKLFLGDSRCVFVVAMDYDTVSGIAAKKFGEGVHIRGQEYLEKIVQLPFFLPRVELSMLGSAYGPWVPEDVDPDLLWVLINAALGTNPRKAKRFLNSLAMSVRTLSLERRDSGNHHDGIWLAKLLIVQIEFPAFFRYLSRTPEAWSLLESGNSTERDGELAGFASDDRLMRFLEDTSARSYHPFPPAPTSNDLSRLMSIASTGLGGP